MTRPVFSKNDPQRIPRKLTEKELNKTIKIFLKNGDTRSGILTGFDFQEITIMDPASNNQDTFPFEAVEKIEIKTKTYAPFVVLTVVGVLVLLGILIADGYAGAINQMGV
jgi:small nuclear ribonucleoprotein (snRNP)-like protein